MRRERAWAAVALAIALLAAACGDDAASSDPTEPTAEATADTATAETVAEPTLPDDDPDGDGPDDGTGDEKADLEDVLLTLGNVQRLVGDDLAPFGDEPTDDEDPICNGERASDRVPPTELAEGPAFAPGQQGPVVSSDAWRFDDADTASAWLDAVQALVAECIGVVQYEAADGTITVEWEPVATFDLLGDRTISYRGASIAGPDLRADWVLVQLDDLVVDLLHIDLSGGAPDAEVTQSLVDLLVAKASN
jgi:hypothetical protein